MNIIDLITPPVTTCTGHTEIANARDLMNIKKVSALPIVKMEGNEVTLQGIVTYHDLAGVYDDDVTVEQVMTKDVTTILPTASVKDAAYAMISNRIHHLVVVEENKILGIVSSFDFVKLVAKTETA